MRNNELSQFEAYAPIYIIIDGFEFIVSNIKSKKNPAFTSTFNIFFWWFAPYFFDGYVLVKIDDKSLCSKLYLHSAVD